MQLVVGVSCLTFDSNFSILRALLTRFTEIETIGTKYVMIRAKREFSVTQTTAPEGRTDHVSVKLGC